MVMVFSWKSIDNSVDLHQLIFVDIHQDRVTSAVEVEKFGLQHVLLSGSYVRYLAAEFSELGLEVLNVLELCKAEQLVSRSFARS
jgi:hypothetical protein